MATAHSIFFALCLALPVIIWRVAHTRTSQSHWQSWLPWERWLTDLGCLAGVALLACMVDPLAIGFMRVDGVLFAPHCGTSGWRGL